MALFSARVLGVALAGLIAAVLGAAPPAVNDTRSAVERPGHPKLYASADELAGVKRAFLNDRGAYAQYLPKLGGTEAEIVPLTRGVTAQRSMILLARYAVAYRVTGDNAYREALRQWLPEIETYAPPPIKSIGGGEGLTAGHVLLGTALVYDLMAGDDDVRLTEAFRSLLKRQAAATFRDLSALTNFPYEQNHLIIPVCGLAIGSLAILEDEPAAKDWLAFSESVLEVSIQALGRDGWFFEGSSYWNYTMQFPICYGLAAKRVTGREIFNAPIFRHAIVYLAHIMLPGGDFTFDFGDWGPRVEGDGKGFQAGYDLPWHTLTSRPKLFIPMALEREKGGRDAFSRDLIAFLASRNPNKSGSTAIDAVFMLLWGVPSQPATEALGAHPEVPTFHYFDDHGVVHWRENWSDPDAVAVAFKAGPPAGHDFTHLLKQHSRWRPSLGHAHPDAGSFILFAGGAFLAGDTGYTGKKETADHNSLLIDGVGQHKGGTAWATFEGKPYDEYDQIALSEVWLNDVVVAATSHLTAAYDDALRMTRVERKFLLVAGRYLLVADHLASAVPHVYEWRWHSDRCAEVRGDTAEFWDQRAGLVVKNLLPIDDMRVGASIVETELYATKRPRPQQRGYYLAALSPLAAEHRFLTAAYVRRRPAESATLSKQSEACVRYTTGNETCTLWHQAGDGLAGTYAFTLADARGNVTVAGMRGSSLATPHFTVSAKTPVSLLLRFRADDVEIVAEPGLGGEITFAALGSTRTLRVGDAPVRFPRR